MLLGRYADPQRKEMGTSTELTPLVSLLFRHSKISYDILTKIFNNAICLLFRYAHCLASVFVLPYLCLVINVRKHPKALM